MQEDYMIVQKCCGNCDECQKCQKKEKIAVKKPNKFIVRNKAISQKKIVKNINLIDT